VKGFTDSSQKHRKQREGNMKKLRPNLINPKCQQELKELDEVEKLRSEENKKLMESISKDFKDGMFNNAT
jgi:hypothetical protein